MGIVDELIERLSQVAEGGVAGPALICGLGEWGRSCLGKLSARLRELPSNWDQLVTVSIDPARPGSLQAPVRKWLGRAKADDRLGWSLVLRVHEGQLVDYLAKKVDQALALGSLEVPQWRVVRLIVLADAADAFASVAALEIARVLGDIFEQKAGGLARRKVGLFLLPDGKSNVGESVFAFLEDLGTGNLSSRPAAAVAVPSGGEETRLFDFVGVTSPSNLTITLAYEETAAMAAEMVILLCHPETSRLMEQTLESATGEAALFSFGISAVAYPASQLAKANASDFAARLIRKTVLGREGFFQGSIREFCSREGLDSEMLYEAMLEGHKSRGSLLDAMGADPLYFQGVSPRYWPDRIASYDAYLQSQLSGKELAVGEENLRKVESRLASAIRAMVNRMVGSGAPLERVRLFLSVLSDHVAEEHLRAIRRQEEALKSIPPLTEEHHRLVNRLQNLPRREALAARFFILAPLLYFVALIGRQILKALPERLLNQALIPSHFWTQLFLLVAIPAAFWLSYQRAESRVLGARQAYLDSVERRHKYVIEFWARRAVVWLTSPEDREELAARGLSGLTSLIRAELADVERLARNYERSLSMLERKSGYEEEAPGGRVRFSALEAFDLSKGLKYKRGNFSEADELNLFLVGGGHLDWRRLDAEEISRRWLRFASAGYDYVTQGSLAQPGWGNLSAAQWDRVLDLLRHRSKPFLFLRSAAPVPTEMMTFLRPTAVGRGQPEKAVSLSWYDPHQLTYVQVCGGFSSTDIRGFDSWRKRYEKRPDKDVLHWASWQVIDLPAAGEA